jgi:hypothetical protein
MPQCLCKTTKGIQCKLNALKGSAYCGIHKNCLPTQSLVSTPSSESIPPTTSSQQTPKMSLNLKSKIPLKPSKDIPLKDIPLKPSMDILLKPSKDIPLKPSNDTYCDTLGGLSNFANSCYLDSTIVSLLFTKKVNNYIENVMLNADLNGIIIKTPSTLLSKYPQLYKITKLIQTDLRLIRDTIVTGIVDQCVLLRHHLQDYQDQYEKDLGVLGEEDETKAVKWLQKQLEPIDVMMRLNKIFGFPDQTSVRITSYGVNSGKPFEFAEKYRIIPNAHFVAISDLADVSLSGDVKDKDSADLEKMITISDSHLDPCDYFITDDKTLAFRTRREVTQILDSPFFYVHLSRLYKISGTNKKAKIGTPVVPLLTLKLKDKSLTLISIIIHHGSASGGHYFCYLNCDETWYKYNDVGFTKLIKIGSFEQLLENKVSQDDVMLHSTDYFYM